jgi:glutathione S-transferase
MNTELPLVFYHAPNTRSTGVLLLLEELGATYSLQLLNVKRGDHKAQAYLAVNPLGKVPAIRHGTALVPKLPLLVDYAARVNVQPAMIRGREKDVALAAGPSPQ